MPDHKTLAALITAALLFCAADSAMASEYHYAGERAAHNQEVDRLVAHARLFWQARGLPTCQPTVLLADSLADVDVDAALLVNGRAEMRTCRLWLRTGLVRAQQRWGGSELCTTVLHEVGHLAGLDHTPTGIMATDGGSAVGPCRAWSHPRRCKVKRLRSGAVSARCRD